VENLVVQTGALSGTGNALGNIIAVLSASGATVSGAGGNDTIVGGTGNDTIDGGAGSDILTGSLGADSFVFHKGEANGDTVTDFSHAAHDVLSFAGFGAGSTLTHPDPAGHPTDWVITDGGDHTTETIHLANNPASLILGTDYIFV
jgi:Ca2+-binding RTX toxin-like protein